MFERDGGGHPLSVSLLLGKGGGGGVSSEKPYNLESKNQIMSVKYKK